PCSTLTPSFKIPQVTYFGQFRFSSCQGSRTCSLPNQKSWGARLSKPEKEDGTTPATTNGTPFKVIDWPNKERSAANSLRQIDSPITTMRSADLLRSSG